MIGLLFGKNYFIKQYQFNRRMCNDFEAFGRGLEELNNHISRMLLTLETINTFMNMNLYISMSIILYITFSTEDKELSGITYSYILKIDDVYDERSRIKLSITSYGFIEKFNIVDYTEEKINPPVIKN